MEHRPITVDAAGVRAILAGTETQTCRPIDPQPANGWEFEQPPSFGRITSRHPKRGKFGVFIRRGVGTDFPEIDIIISPYGQPGHTLWVREDALELGCWIGEGGTIWSTAGTVHYLADGQPPVAPEGLLWKEVPAIDLRRKHSRITLEIVSVQIAKRKQWEWVIEFKKSKGVAA